MAGPFVSKLGRRPRSDGYFGRVWNMVSLGWNNIDM